MNLADLFILLILAAAAAWLWRGHGIRERALNLVQQHCEKLEVQLLDGNVALRRLRLLRDGRGQRRLARVYDFEFTVTGEQRHVGSISMFGQHLGKIELDAHPYSNPRRRRTTGRTQPHQCHRTGALASATPRPQ